MTKVTHRISWYVWTSGHSGPAEKMRHTASMRGTWGWDAECSCGWGSHTGGATRSSVERDVWRHKHIDLDGPGLPLSSQQYQRPAILDHLEAER